MTCDPGIGVLRHVDAGYEQAIDSPIALGYVPPCGPTHDDALVRGAGQLLTLRGTDGPRRGAALRDLGLISDGAVLITDG